MSFTFCTVLGFIVGFGLFGGIASYLAFCVYGVEGGFREKFSENFSPIILLTNGLIGVAGALAIQVLVIGMRFYEKGEPVVSDFIYLAAICLIGGFAARSYLNQVSQMFAKQIEQKLEENKKKVERVEDRQAKQFVLAAALGPDSEPVVLEAVVRAADLGLKKNPDDGTFVVTKATALRHLGKLPQAIETLTRYLDAHRSATQRDKFISSAYYNRACYYAVQGNAPAALSDLKRALELSENVADDKAHAKTDEDFKSLRSNATFQTLVA
jgi:tetratricopeptide (TPR) repeat protein